MLESARLHRDAAPDPVEAFARSATQAVAFLADAAPLDLQET